MNKKTSLLALLGLAALPSLASAQLYRPASPYTLASMLQSAETAVWVIFTGIVVVCFVIAGIILLTAQGDVEKIKSGRLAVIWGVAGVVVGILAYSILAIISAVLSGRQVAISRSQS